MKGNEEKYMLGQELALFTHHHKDWSFLAFLPLDSTLTWGILHLKFMHIFLWNVYRAHDAAVQLGNVLHFIKIIPSQALSGLETCLFINEPFTTLIPSHSEMSGDKLKSQLPPGLSGLHSDQLSSAFEASESKKVNNRHRQWVSEVIPLGTHWE